MTLDHETADVVRFHCAACGQEHSVRQIRKQAAICQHCRGDVWNLVTEYQEVEQSYGLTALAVRVLFGPIIGGLLNRQTKMIPIETPNVPSEEVLAIAQAGLFKQGRWAYKYMELRRSLDAASERELLRDRGGTNCKVCNMFFVPVAEKSWSEAGYCSKGCAASAGVPVDIVSPPPPPKSIEPRTAPAKSIKLDCSCGHSFEVSAMYVGTPRQCPMCHKKVMVNPIAPGSGGDHSGSHR